MIGDHWCAVHDRRSLVNVHGHPIVHDRSQMPVCVECMAEALFSLSRTAVRVDRSGVTGCRIER